MIQPGTPQQGFATSVFFRTFDDGRRAARGRALLLDPATVAFRLHYEPQVLAQDFGPTSRGLADFEALVDTKLGGYQRHRPYTYDELSLSKDDIAYWETRLWAVDNVVHGVQLTELVGHYPGVLAASNSLQTNFKGPNGFLIEDGRVIQKTQRGIRQREWKPLDGEYSAFIIKGSCGVGVGKVPITLDDFRDVHDANSMKAEASDPKRPIKSIIQAISGPEIVNSNRFVSPKKRPDGFSWLVGDEVDWDPDTTPASWSAIGKAGNRIVLCHLMGFGDHEPLVKDMADVLIRDFDVEQAILLGGAADVQQYVAGDQGGYLQAGARRGTATRDNAIGAGFRDLGAAILVFGIDSNGFLTS